MEKRLCQQMLFSPLPVLPHQNLWPLSLLLTFEALWKHRPHLFFCNPSFTEVSGAQMHLAVFVGLVQVFWQPWGWRSHSRPEGEDGVTADWVSRADSRRHGWKETSCSTLGSHSLIDFSFADVYMNNMRLRPSPLLFEFHMYFSFQTTF